MFQLIVIHLYIIYVIYRPNSLRLCCAQLGIIAAHFEQSMHVSNVEIHRFPVSCFTQLTQFIRLLKSTFRLM